MRRSIAVLVVEAVDGPDSIARSLAAASETMTVERVESGAAVKERVADAAVVCVVCDDDLPESDANRSSGSTSPPGSS